MPTLSDQLRQAIERSGLSHNEIARQTKIPQPTITRFVNGLDMRLSNADRLAAHFGLTLQPGKAKPRRPSR
ncbi:MAG: helix-turn-helix transcriptional regulator [Pirellulales bacterium]